MNFIRRKYTLFPLVCSVLLGVVSCNELLSNLVVVPLAGVRAFLNLDISFFKTQTEAGGVNEVGDRFGEATFPGDVNGDGFVDLAVGAPEKNGGAGAVFIFLGSEAGATVGGFSLTQADAGEVGAAGDRFGASLVSGDFNGDLIDDMVVGSPGKSVGGVKSGAVFIFQGRADGTFEPGVLLTQTDAGEVNEAGDQFGAVLATADFDGDGLDELLVGAPEKAIGGGPKSGAVFIFAGAPGGLVFDRVLTQEDAGGTNEAGDRFGASIESAHFNGTGGVDFGDGFADLAIGAPGKDGDTGAVFVFVGSASGFAEGFVVTQTDALGLAGCVPTVPGSCVAGVNEAGDRFGAELGVGDLNGDGVEELAVGAPGEDANSGAVYIFPGSRTIARGITTGYYITQGNAKQANQPGDEFGSNVSAGVLNEDENEELVVGAPGKNSGSGAIFVFPGTVQQTGTIKGFMITQADAGGVDEAGDRFGAVLTIEDFNDNNGADVAVAAPGDAPDGVTRSGAVYIFPGVPTSPPAFTGEDACKEVAGVIRPALPAGGPSAQPCTVNNEAGDAFGSAAATGDFNGDGFVDLAMGAPGKGGGSGAVFIFPGSLNGKGITTGFFITQADAGGVDEAGDEFGAAVATGDFNDDGFVDLAVGAPGEDGGSGAVFIFPGSVNGLTCIADVACPTTIITGSFVTQADAGGANEAGDRFGAALAVGDFDADGIEDLAVGAPGDGLGGVTAGSVFVFTGSRSGFIPTGTPPPTGITTGFQITQTKAAGAVNEDGDRFGATLAAANIVGDAFQELIVGAPGDAPGGGPTSGSVFVFPGSAAGLGTGSTISQTTATTTGEANEAGDEFGAAIVVGDFNGDFILDLAVGAPGDAPTAVSPTKAGSVFVFMGSAAGITAGPFTVITHEDLTSAEDIALTTPLADGDRFGAALATGKFNDDIFDELIVGAPGKAPTVATDPTAGTLIVFPGSDGSTISDGVTLAEGISVGVFITQKGNGGEIEDGDEFAAALAVGDFNGDLLNDLIVGAPGDALGAEPATSGVASLLPAGEVRFQIRP